MNLSARLKFFFLFAFFVLVFTACKKNKLKKTAWESEILLPVAHGSLGIPDLNMDSILTIDTSSLLHLVYQSTLYNLSLVEQDIKVPDTAINSVVRLDSIKIDDRKIDFPITLGMLARSDQSGVGALILALHGTTAPLPAVNNLSSNGIQLDATSIFENALIDSGYLDITIKNEFPVPIENVIFQLSNESNGQIVIQDTFPLIPKGASLTHTFDLAGKWIDGHMVGNLLNLDSPGSNGVPVLIDTNKAITISFFTHGLSIIEATAIFPAQNLIDISDEVVYDMGGPEFTSMKIRSGNLIIAAINTIEDSLKLHYTIPGAISSSGEAVDIFASAAPAPPGGSTQILKSFDLAGYTIDLTGFNHNKSNTFYNTFTAGIDSSGKLIHLSLSDSVSVTYGLQNIVPEFVKGYLGQHSFTVGPAAAPFNLFNIVKQGSISLEKADMRFSIYNHMGVEGNIRVNSITGINSKSGQQINLTAPVIGQNIPLKRAFLNPNSTGVTSILLDNQNSNIKALIENMPDQLQYQLDFSINPNGNTFNYQDFAYYDDVLQATMDLDIPISLQAQALTMLDTNTFDLGLNNEDFAPLQSATFTLYLENGFPIDAEVQVYFLDHSFNMIDSLFAGSQLIHAATLNPADCMVDQKVKSDLSADFDLSEISLINSAGYAVIKIILNTPTYNPCNGPIKIYSHYAINYKLAARLKLLLNEDL